MNERAKEIGVDDMREEMQMNFVMCRKELKVLKQKADVDDKGVKDDLKMRIDVYQAEKEILNRICMWLSTLNQRTVSFEKYMEKVDEIREEVMSEIQEEETDEEYFHAPHEMDTLRKYVMGGGQ